MIAAFTSDQGSFVYPSLSGTIAPSTTGELDAAVQVLQEHKQTWADLPIAERLALIKRISADFAAVSQTWVDQVVAAQRIAGNDSATGTEWMSGPYAVQRNLRCLESSLRRLASGKLPKIPGAVHTRPDGQVVAQAFPQTLTDRLLFNGFRAEVWMQPQVRRESLAQTQSLAYGRPHPQGKVALVLGAGNVGGIPPTDALDRLFVQNQVVVLKMNPVNDYLGPIFARGFRSLIEAGYLRIVFGAAAEGAYLCQHAGVDEIFVTGSDKTFEAIVFGPGADGARRKAERSPLLEKPVYGELGNVTPVIIVPGEWTQEQIDYHAENLASWIMGNASAACNTPRVLILHAGWAQGEAFLAALRRVFARVPPRYAFYPGSQERFAAFLQAYPQAEQIGEPGPGELPWTIIPQVDSPRPDELCFTTEAFCSVFTLAHLPAASLPEFLEKAVDFANRRLWGTLAASIFIHPDTLKDPAVHQSLDRAIAGLRYGTVAVNCGALLNWAIMTTPWGAFPGQDIYDIQSGNDFVHNTLMFSAIQKAVIYGSFIEQPKPITFISRGHVLQQLGPLLTGFMASPSLLKLVRVMGVAVGSK